MLPIKNKIVRIQSFAHKGPSFWWCAEKELKGGKETIKKVRKEKSKLKVNTKERKRKR